MFELIRVTPHREVYVEMSGTKAQCYDWLDMHYEMYLVMYPENTFRVREAR